MLQLKPDLLRRQVLQRQEVLQRYVLPTGPDDQTRADRRRGGRRRNGYGVRYPGRRSDCRHEPTGPSAVLSGGHYQVRYKDSRGMLRLRSDLLRKRDHCGLLRQERGLLQ